MEIYSDLKALLNFNIKRISKFRSIPVLQALFKILNKILNSESDVHKNESRTNFKA